MLLSTAAKQAPIGSAWRRAVTSNLGSVGIQHCVQGGVAAASCQTLSVQVGCFSEVELLPQLDAPLESIIPAHLTSENERLHEMLPGHIGLGTFKHG